jgi:hypothetical protein
MIVADLVFCALFLFCFFSMLCLVYSMLSIHDCCRFSFLRFVFSLFVSVLCLVYSVLSIHDCRFCFLRFVFIFTRHNTEKNKIKTKRRKQNRQSWMDNTEYTRHNTETNKLKTKRSYFVFLRVVSCIPNIANVSGCPFMIVADLVFCVLFYCVCLRVVSCVLNVVHWWLPILLSVFCFYFVCLRVVSCILNVANVSGCPFMFVADLVFCALFLFCFFSVLCLVFSMLSI